MKKRFEEKKKGLAFLAVMILAFSLVGCSEGKEETKTFETNQNGVDISVTYRFKKDIVTKQTAMMKISYSSLGVSTKEEAEEATKDIAGQYQGITGLKETLDFKKDYLIEKVEVDYNKVNFEELVDIPGMSFSSNPKKDMKNGISMKKSQEMIEKSGFKEKK